MVPEDIFLISSLDGEGINGVLKTCYHYVEEQKKGRIEKQKISESENDRVVYTPHLNESARFFTLELLSDDEKKDRELGEVLSHVFQVEGKRIVQIAKMTNFDQPE